MKFFYCIGFVLMGYVVYLWTNDPKKQIILSEEFVKDTSVTVKPEVDMMRLKQKAKTAKAFCIKRGFNDRFCLLIDMSLHSGLKRFFVWDLKGDSVMHRFM